MRIKVILMRMKSRSYKSCRRREVPGPLSNKLQLLGHPKVVSVGNPCNNLTWCHHHDWARNEEKILHTYVADNHHSFMMTHDWSFYYRYRPSVSYRWFVVRVLSENIKIVKRVNLNCSLLSNIYQNNNNGTFYGIFMIVLKYTINKPKLARRRSNLSLLPPFKLLCSSCICSENLKSSLHEPTRQIHILKPHHAAYFIR